MAGFVHIYAYVSLFPFFFPFFPRAIWNSSNSSRCIVLSYINLLTTAIT